MSQTKNPPIQFKDFNFEIKAVQEDGFFSGYASVFGNMDSYGDIVEKGAFAETLSNWQAKNKLPPVLWNHKTDEPIGVYTLMREDDRGLYVEGKLLVAEVQRAKEIHALMKAGAVDGMSIGYSTLDYRMDTENDIRYLTRVKLWENSIVTFPANDLSRIDAVKAALHDGQLPTLPEFEKFLREAGFSKTQATAIAGHGLRQLLSDSEVETAKSTNQTEAMKSISSALSILQGN